LEQWMTLRLRKLYSSWCGESLPPSPYVKPRRDAK